MIVAHAQTLGKRWLGVRILRSDGSRPTLSRVALLRELVPMLISAIPFVGRSSRLTLQGMMCAASTAVCPSSVRIRIPHSAHRRS